MSKSVSLESYMAKRVVTVKASATILEASKIIINEQVSGVCVVDDDDNLVGVLSELDCLRAVIERVYENNQSSAGYVYEAMTKEIVSNRPDEDIISVAESMLGQKHRRRPILDGEKMIGQVDCRTLLAAIKNFG